MRQRFQGGVYRLRPAACLSTAIQRNAAPAGYGGPGRREKLKITEMRIPSKGEIVRTDTAHKGEIVILPSDSVGLNDVLGDDTRLPRERWRDAPLPMLRTTIAPQTATQRERLLDALTQLADTDPLLRCEVDSKAVLQKSAVHRCYKSKKTSDSRRFGRIHKQNG